MSSTAQPLIIGSTVFLAGTPYRLRYFIDLQTVIVEGQDGSTRRLAVAEILAAMTRPANEEVDPAGSVESSGFESLSERAWEVAQQRAATLVPLLAPVKPTRAMAEDAATQLGVHVSTVYRWISRFKATGSVAELAPKSPTGGRGKNRIAPEVEAIVVESLRERFLTAQRIAPARLIRDIWARCKRNGLRPPHPNTVRRRIAALSARQLVSARHGRKAADDRFQARPGQFAGADWPNAVWQIDHTPIDLVIVDDVHRRHVGRPWLTVVIDVYSRCIAGFYLSLDPPSEISVGMCLVNAMLAKDGWLAELNVSTPWPLYGRPTTVHADNAKEFRGAMLTRAAEQYTFNLEWRKVKTPHWGAHIERLLGTFNAEIHAVPGTTFSNPADRGEYAPHKEAVLTFAECERYLAEFITGLYHQRVHGELGRPPIRQYEFGLLGDGLNPGKGLPAPIEDPKRLRLDFLPLDERTVQANGITLDGITYFDPVLEPWVRSCDPSTKRPRKFIVRRDPRDISVIFFLDPDTQRYYPIPYRRLEWPQMTIWELREVKAQLRKEGRAEVDEELIFETHERLSKLVEQASITTVSARKAMQKKRERPRRKDLEHAQAGSKIHRPATPTPDDWDEGIEATPFEVRLK